MLTREDVIENSVQHFAREWLFGAGGYSPERVELVESYPYKVEDEQELERNLVAAGFNFDEPGVPAEMGSSLTRRTYTVQFIVVGTTRAYGQNISSALKFAFEKLEAGVPLLDFTQPATPIVDFVDVISTSSNREVIPEPAPYEEYVFTTTVKLEDTYYADPADE